MERSLHYEIQMLTTKTTGESRPDPDEALLRLTLRGRWQVKLPGAGWADLAERYQDPMKRTHKWEVVLKELQREFPRLHFRQVMPEEAQRLSIVQRPMGGRS